MGFEFEVKFAATEEKQDAIRNALSGVWKSVAMETTYYDTSAGELSALHYTLRCRLENGEAVCTVKTPAGILGRGEWEVCCKSIEEAIPKLCKLGAPEQLATITRNGIIAICGAQFTRQVCTVVTDDGTAELALDRGILFAGSRQLPLCEVEVELKTGLKESTAAYAEDLAKRYGLQPEPKSKFQRALALREERENGTAE